MSGSTQSRLGNQANTQIKVVAVIVLLLGIAMLVYWGMFVAQGMPVAGIPVLSELVNAALALISGIGLLRLRKWSIPTSLFTAGMWAFPWVLPLAIGLVLLGCAGERATTVVSVPYEIIPPEQPAPKADRRFGITISEGSEGFAAAFDVARQAGVQVVELNLPWNVIETAPGRYEDPWGVLEAVAFYGEHDVEVTLSLAAINTVERTTPAYLDDLPFDDPSVISAFNRMVDWVMATVPANVTVPGVAIGNEIDLFLASDAEWSAYAAFYQATADHVQTQYPDIKVGVKITVMQGLMEDNALEKAQALNQPSDVIMLNYYPQDDAFQVLPPDVVHQHLRQIIELFPGWEIWLTEVGYQSGAEHCNSSEAKQAAFYHELFSAWDDHRQQVTLVLVDWLHDQSPRQIAEWKRYYGSSNPAFVEYLSTLGLRRYDHTDKAAWLQVLAETRARGWEESAYPTETGE